MGGGPPASLPWPVHSSPAVSSFCKHPPAGTQLPATPREQKCIRGGGPQRRGEHWEGTGSGERAQARGWDRLRGAGHKPGVLGQAQAAGTGSGCRGQTRRAGHRLGVLDTGSGCWTQARGARREGSPHHEPALAQGQAQVLPMPCHSRPRDCRQAGSCRGPAARLPRVVQWEPGPWREVDRLSLPVAFPFPEARGESRPCSSPTVWFLTLPPVEEPARTPGGVGARPARALPGVSGIPPTQSCPAQNLRDDLT